MKTATLAPAEFSESRSGQDLINAGVHSRLDQQINGKKRYLPMYQMEDESSAPSLMVSGSRKREWSVVEFVYPKADGTYPFVFNMQRQGSKRLRSDRNVATESEILTVRPLDCDSKVKATSESIDDILFCRRDDSTKQAHGKHAKSDKEAIAIEKDSSSSQSQDRREKLAPQSVETPGVGNDPDRGSLTGLSIEDAVRDKHGCRPRANSTDGELNLPRRGLCDERIVLESHKWRNSLGRVPPKGLMNLGNTCFLNATLQCLAYLPTFSQTLTSIGVSNGTKTSTGQKVTAMLISLFRQIHGGAGEGNVASVGAISPRGIVTALPSLGSSGSRNGYKFRPGRQEDAHEFLVHLLDAMHDGELKAAGINQHASGWRDRLPIPRLDETTFIHRIFGGYLRSQVRCTNCGYRSNTYDPFLDLSLEVSKKSAQSIASAFSEFTRRETLDTANRWKCIGCKKHVCASKQLTVFRPPLSLCVQLKRFTYGGGFGNVGGWGHYGGKGFGLGMGGSKISKSIDFPADLNLPLSDKRKCDYRLTGVIVHTGGSASSGHYTAYVKKPTPDSNQWYHMDDSFVEAVSEKAVLRQKDAYVLFYVRKEVKIEYPAPPPRSSMSATEAVQHGIVRARARANSLDGVLPSGEHPQSVVSTADSTTDNTAGTANERQKIQISVSGPPQLASQTATTSTKEPASSGTTKSENTGEESSSDSSTTSGSSSEQSTTVIPARQDHPETVLQERKVSSTIQQSTTVIPSRQDHPETVLQERKVSSTIPRKQAELETARLSERSPKENSSTSSSSKESDTELSAAHDHTDSTGNRPAGEVDSSSAKDSESSPSKQKCSSGTSDSDSSDGSSTSDSTSSESSDSSDDDKVETEEIADVCAEPGNARLGVTNSFAGGPTQQRYHHAAPQRKSLFEPTDVDPGDHRGEMKSRLDSQDGDGAGPGAVENPSSADVVPVGQAKEKRKTRIVLDRGGMRGKLEVMLGPRRGPKAWKPRTTMKSQDGKGNELLGSVRVGKWADDEHEVYDEGNVASQLEQRQNVVLHQQRIERSRKRKMHPDHWDARLDEGKTKKVKSKQEFIFQSKSDTMNPFQRIQSSMQRLKNGGKGKDRQHHNSENSRRR